MQEVIDKGGRVDGVDGIENGHQYHGAWEEGERAVVVADEKQLGLGSSILDTTAALHRHEHQALERLSRLLPDRGLPGRAGLMRTHLIITPRLLAAST